jgi:hypothetical protein
MVLTGESDVQRSSFRKIALAIRSVIQAGAVEAKAGQPPQVGVEGAAGCDAVDPYMRSQFVREGRD